MTNEFFDKGQKTAELKTGQAALVACPVLREIKQKLSFVFCQEFLCQELKMTPPLGFKRINIAVLCGQVYTFTVLGYNADYTYIRVVL